MMRSKIIENHSITVEGVLDSSTELITMDIEDRGVRNMQGLLASFNGKNVKLTVRLVEEVPTNEGPSFTP